MRKANEQNSPSCKDLDEVIIVRGMPQDHRGMFAPLLYPQSIVATFFELYPKMTTNDRVVPSKFGQRSSPLIQHLWVITGAMVAYVLLACALTLAITAAYYAYSHMSSMRCKLNRARVLRKKWRPPSLNNHQNQHRKL